jgi:hypothetical protein
MALVTDRKMVYEKELKSLLEVGIQVLKMIE